MRAAGAGPSESDRRPEGRGDVRGSPGAAGKGSPRAATHPKTSASSSRPHMTAWCPAARPTYGLPSWPPRTAGYTPCRRHRRAAARVYSAQARPQGHDEEPAQEGRFVQPPEPGVQPQHGKVVRRGLQKVVKVTAGIHFCLFFFFVRAGHRPREGGPHALQAACPGGGEAAGARAKAPAGTRGLVGAIRGRMQMAGARAKAPPGRPSPVRTGPGLACA